MFPSLFSRLPDALLTALLVSCVTPDPAQGQQAAARVTTSVQVVASLALSAHASSLRVEQGQVYAYTSIAARGRFAVVLAVVETPVIAIPATHAETPHLSCGAEDSLPTRATLLKNGSRHRFGLGEAASLAGFVAACTTYFFSTVN